MNRVIHFEIHSSKPERAIKFYSDAFGWKIDEWKIPGVEIAAENRYWTVMTAPEGSQEPGISGGIVVRQGEEPKGGEPVTSFICTIGVSSVDDYGKKIEAAGGKSASPKMPIMGFGWLAYYIDCEGNKFGIMEEDKNAK
jgi:uncharacterized protein